MSKADMFLRLEGKSTGLIKGESNVAEHPDEIEINEWSWGMSGSSALGGSGASVKSALKEIRFGKGCDRSSTQLMSVLRNNEVIKKAVLSVRKAGVSPPVEYLQITLVNGRITSLDLGSVAPGNPTLAETFTMAFEEITVAYAPQESSGGKGAKLEFVGRVTSN
ncbi:MAG: type VI secretion system tube protein Hcp [Rubrivivax sp.]